MIKYIYCLQNMTVEPERVENKYTRTYPKPFPELPEPKRMFRILADEDPLNIHHPMHPFTKALLARGWSTQVEEIANEIGQKPEQIRKLGELFTGLLKVDAEKDTISLIIPD